MKLSIHSRLRRRDFVQWIGGAAFALPCLELFELQAKAQTAAVKQAKYAVFIYTNDGMHPPGFFPTTADPTASKTLSPLAPYKSKVLLLGAPVGANGYPMANQGITYNSKPAQHRANICFTGSQVMQPLNGDQFNAVNKGDGPSMDFVIAQAVQKSGPLLLAMHPIGGDTPSDVTYDMAGNPQTRLSTATAIGSAVFGGGPGGPVGAGQAAAALQEQTAVSNFLGSRFGTIRSQLSVTDQHTIDQHLTSLRTYETAQAELLAMQMNPASACMAPSAASVPTDPTSLSTGADVKPLSAFIMQTVALAFNCGKTKVATISFGYPGGGGAGGLRMPWLGFGDPQHGVSHNGGDPVQAGKYQQMNQWTISQVTLLMDQLSAIKTVAGTMLDETVIYLVNRHGDGNGHSNFALPSIICGGAGGYFKMGVNMMLPTTSPTKVLISLAHSMGVPVTSFGTGPYADTMPVPGIAA